LIHLAAEKGARVLPVSVEDCLISIYYYLDKSSKRQKELKEFQLLHNVEVRKIIKHVSTRWLSLGICLERILSQWMPLKDFFKSECMKSTKVNVVLEKDTHKNVATIPDKGDNSKCNQSKHSDCGVDFLFSNRDSVKSKSIQSHKSDKNVTGNNTKVKVGNMKTKHISPSHKKVNDKRKLSESVVSTSGSLPGVKKAEQIYQMLRNKDTMLYCLFLKNVLPLFDDANKILQNEKPCIHILHSVLDVMLKNILMKFVKPSAIVAVKCNTSVCYQDKDNQKGDTGLSIGSAARQFIQEHSKYLNLEKFYSAVRLYFTTVCDYMIKKFPYGDELLVHAQVADVSRRLEMDFSSVSFFVERFPCITHVLGNVTVDELENEFLAYQVDALTKDILTADRADTAWHLISEMKDSVSTKVQKYGTLSKVMMAVLCIFHSNSDCERIFSFVTKTKTKYRPNLCTRTLSSIVTHKVTMQSLHEKAYTANPSAHLLKDAKRATYEMLNA